MRKLCMFNTDRLACLWLQELSQALAAKEHILSFLISLSLVRCDVTLLGDDGLLAVLAAAPQFCELSLELPHAWAETLTQAYTEEQAGQAEAAAAADKGASLKAATALWCASCRCLHNPPWLSCCLRPVVIACRMQHSHLTFAIW